jgi:hypothetical protein
MENSISYQVWIIQWVIIPFDLAKALAIFQKYINSILNDFFNKFCLAYMNDVFIYSDGSCHRLWACIVAFGDALSQ